MVKSKSYLQYGCALIVYLFFIKFHEIKCGILVNCSPLKGEICVELPKCPFFVKLFDEAPIPRPRSLFKKVRQYHCGYVGLAPKVCCTFATETVATHSVRDPPDVKNHPNLYMLPKNSCGQTTHRSRITGGSQTSPMEFPWMAILTFKTVKGFEPKCGGTIINTRYILTAAHCVTDPTLTSIRLGEHDLFSKMDCDEETGICAPPAQDFRIEHITIHPEYSRVTKENDIALIRLATPANFSENIQPICLPVGETSKINLDNKYTIAAGWGVTEKGYRSEKLLQVALPVIPVEMCQKISINYNNVNYRQICAGGKLGKDSCGGDSGGPLKYILKENGRSHFIQYGIVSYGPRYCGTTEDPGVYTNVVYYMDWILNNLKPPLD